MAGTLTVAGMSAGENAGMRVFGPLTITGTTVIGDTFAGPLAMGDNTIAVPLGAVAVLIVPPVNNTTTLKVRTSLNAADAGLPVNSGAVPFLLPFPATAPTTVIVNSSGATSAFCTVAFI